MIKIAIAEDHPRLVEGLKFKLAPYKDIQIISIARNGKELLDKLATSSAQPDLILMDIQMPEMDGIETTEKITQAFPQIKIVMLTVFDDDDKVFDSIMAGASGYILKEEKGEIIYNAIIDTVKGGAGISRAIASKVLRLMRNPLPKTEKLDVLTKRERELLVELKSGMTYEQIADKLCISYGTVRKHIENIYKKLRAHSRTEALEKAFGR